MKIQTTLFALSLSTCIAFANTANTQGLDPNQNITIHPQTQVPQTQVPQTQVQTPAPNPVAPQPYYPQPYPHSYHGLPQKVTNFIQKNYPGAFIKDIDWEGYGYEVELSHGLELFFDRNGNFLGSKWD